MSARYTKLPTEETESAVIDFGSPFNYQKPEYPKYFSYSKTDKMYTSIFTYSGYKSGDLGYINVPELSLIQKLCAGLITVLCYVLVFIAFPVTGWFSFKIVPQYQRLVIYRLGRLLSLREPGITITLPCIDRVTKVDMRTRAFSVPPQKVITSDGAVLEVGADIYFRVSDPVLSVSTVQDLNHSLRIIGVASLQKHISRQRLNHIELEKTAMTSFLQTDINQMAVTWGVEIGKIELSQIKVLEEANPIVAAVSNGNDNAMAVLSQLFGNSGMPMPMPMTGVQPMNPLCTNLTKCNQDDNKREEPITPRQLVAIVKPLLSHDLVQQHGVVCKFNVVGDGGGVFYLDLKNGEGSAGEGDPGDKPDVTLTLTLDDMNALFTGRMNAFNAYMGGRLQLDGDLRAAIGLQDLVTRIQAQIGISS